MPSIRRWLDRNANHIALFLGDFAALVIIGVLMYVSVLAFDLLGVFIMAGIIAGLLTLQRIDNENRRKYEGRQD